MKACSGWSEDYIKTLWAAPREPINGTGIWSTFYNGMKRQRIGLFSYTIQHNLLFADKGLEWSFSDGWRLRFSPLPLRVYVWTAESFSFSIQSTNYDSFVFTTSSQTVFVNFLRMLRQVRMGTLNSDFKLSLLSAISFRNKDRGSLIISVVPISSTVSPLHVVRSSSKSSARPAGPYQPNDIRNTKIFWTRHPVVPDPGNEKRHNIHLFSVRNGRSPSCHSLYHSNGV